MFRNLAGMIGLLAWAALLPAHAELVQGRDYTIVRPAKPTGDPTKIEVLEYFSWGCDACFRLYPHLTKWANKMPADTVLVKSAVSLGHSQWAPLAKGFYALEITGDLNRLDGAVFQALHEKRIDLFADDRFTAWAVQQGVNRDKLTKLMANDFTVTKNVKTAETNARAIPINGTPYILVDGRYQVVGAAAKSYADWPPIVEQLVAKVRAERAGKK